MTQDTRKDRRVKIVSLNVRYKSATVDEFIENHAHDVSRGGIYIKTANPFPPGTLLKFEIRLASDQAVIAGVGRVVWKRDAGTSSGERPAGMGVKFIKIDDPSKTVIDKLVNTRADAGKAFESEPEGTNTPEPPVAPPRVTPKGSPSFGGAGVSTMSEARTSTTPGMGATPLARKATMMGLGVQVPSSHPPAAKPQPEPNTSTPPTPATAPPVIPRPTPMHTAPMFPKTDPEKDAPPKQEQTVMKQAAELLEEALREAGGSMEEIGTNPLFAGGAAKAASAPPPKTTPTETPAALADKSAALAEKHAPATDGLAKPRQSEEAAKARAMVAEMAPAPPKVQTSKPPPTARESPTAKVVVEQDATEPSARRRPPSPALARAADAAPAKKGGSGAFVVTFVAVAAIGAGVWLYRDKLIGSTATTDAPHPSASAQTLAPHAPTPSASSSSAVPAADSASAPAEPASAAAASTSAAPSASAGGRPSASAAPSLTPPAVASPRPVAAAKPAAAPAPAPSPSPATESTGETTAAAPRPTTPAGASGSSPSTESAGSGASPSGASTVSTATATPAPKPKAKPSAKPSDDNPY